MGKTHLSVALAEAAIQAGFGEYFMTAHDLVTDLGRAYRKGGWTGARPTVAKTETGWSTPRVSKAQSLTPVSVCVSTTLAPVTRLLRSHPGRSG